MAVKEFNKEGFKGIAYRDKHSRSIVEQHKNGKVVQRMVIGCRVSDEYLEEMIDQLQDIQEYNLYLERTPDGTLTEYLALKAA